VGGPRSRITVLIIRGDIPGVIVSCPGASATLVVGLQVTFRVVFLSTTDHPTAIIGLDVTSIYVAAVISFDITSVFVATIISFDLASVFVASVVCLDSSCVFFSFDCKYVATIVGLNIAWITRGVTRVCDFSNFCNFCSQVGGT
jgi:hypothetical protein